MRLRLPLHGRSHMPQGSDPIKGIILYKVLNSGQWFDMTTTGAAGPSGYNLHLDYQAAGMLVDSTGGGEFQIQTNGGALNLLTDGAVSGSIAIHAGLGVVDIRGDTITLQSTDDIEMRLATGKTITVFDHLGAPKIQWTEGTNDLHIPTSGTIIADL